VSEYTCQYQNLHPLHHFVYIQFAFQVHWHMKTDFTVICIYNVFVMRIIISQRAMTLRRQRSRLIVYEASFSFLSLFFFIPRVISAVTYSIFAIFHWNTCHVSEFKNVAPGFKNLGYLFHRRQKIAKKCTFWVFFHWLTSRLRSLRKNGLS